MGSFGCGYCEPCEPCIDNPTGQRAIHKSTVGTRLFWVPRVPSRETLSPRGDPGPSQPSALPRTLSRARKTTVATVIAWQVKHTRTTVEQPCIPRPSARPPIRTPMPYTASVSGLGNARVARWQRSSNGSTVYGLYSCSTVRCDYPLALCASGWAQDNAM